MLAGYRNILFIECGYQEQDQDKIKVESWNYVSEVGTMEDRVKVSG